MSSKFHLAQINVARMVAEIDDPVMADFANGLDPINALAERSPGFVWRLKTDDGDATALRMFNDKMVIINMSVWEDVDSLHQFTYRSDHTAFFKRRKEWFEAFGRPFFCMWWVPVGHQPTPEEAQERLEHLQTHGPTPYAFTFKQRFEPNVTISN